MNQLIRKYLIRVLNFLGKAYLKYAIHDKDFTIFSNDCYGGEIYRWLELKYNTPFVGLMLMAPCYIKFLQKPQYYLEQPLKFGDTSMYEDMNVFRKEKGVIQLV